MTNSLQNMDISEICDEWPDLWDKCTKKWACLTFFGRQKNGWLTSRATFFKMLCQMAHPKNYRFKKCHPAKVVVQPL
jgi:hypothetical protein